MKIKEEEKAVTSKEDLHVFAQDVASNLDAGDVLLLTGDLGTGKTTFTQGLAIALGISDPVTSPTFTIVQEYEVGENDSIAWLVHIDLYRVPPDQHGVDFDYIAEVIDTAKQNKRVVVVEWPERLSLAVPNSWKLSFKHGKTPNERIISINQSSYEA